MDYRFETGIEGDGRPALEAVKAWREGNQDHEMRLTDRQLRNAAKKLEVDLRELNDVRETRGSASGDGSGRRHGGGEWLSARWARRSASVHRRTARPRSPPLWNANGRRRSSSVSMVTRTRSHSLRSPSRRKQRSGPFGAKFEESAYHLLEPIDPTVNYSFEVMAADPWTLELTADKWWLEADGRFGHEGQTLQTYSLESVEWEREMSAKSRR